MILADSLENTNKYFTIYNKYVLNEQDQILFNEVIQAANINLYRSAYILAWLTCAESLKHKFQICSKHGDNVCKNTYHKITQKEGQHKAVDKYILEQAKAYGFINDLEYDKLLGIYSMRCVYAHPYKEAPSKANLESAIYDIVNIVLSKPAMFGQEYVKSLVTNLTNDENYLDNNEQTVRTAAQEYLSKINENCYKYLFEEYIIIAEQMSHDRTLNLLTNRAKWFIEEIIAKIGFESYSLDDWHELFAIKYPRFMIELSKGNEFFFDKIGYKAKDYLINKIFEYAVREPQLLNILEKFWNDKDFFQNNKHKIDNSTEQINLEALMQSGIKLKFYISKIINYLESGNYDYQNPASRAVETKENEINQLDARTQKSLGRLIHGAAALGSWDAERYFTKIINHPLLYPIDFLLGICDYLFNYYRERNHISFEDIRLKYINNMIVSAQENSEIQSQLIVYMNEWINKTIDIDKDWYEDVDIEKYFQVDKFQWININQ